MAALCTTAGPAMLMDLVPPERRGRVFGAMIGMAYAGLALGPLAAGLVVEHLGWRSVFFVGALWILVGGLPAFVRTAAHGQRRGGSLHVPSTALIVCGMGAVVASVSGSERGGALWPWVVLAAVMLGGFVAWQPRLSAPLLDLRALRHNATLSAALVVQLLLYLNAYCSIVLLSLFLQDGKGMDAHTAGLWLMTGAVLMTLTAPSAGRLADRMRPQRVAGAGVAAVVLSSALGVTLDADSPAFMVGVVLGVQGLGFGLFSSPNLALILGSLPRERSGFASAIAAQSRSLGMFSGMAVASALIAHRFGERALADDPAGVVDVVHGAYVVLLVTSGLALVVAFARRGR
jgi:MFS family permease